MDKIKSLNTGHAFFLKKFLQSPRNIGSIAPSSPFLAKAMLQPIDWKETQSIAELGAGTGVFTRLIQACKPSNCTAVIFEQEREMRERIMQVYPNLHYFSKAENIYADIRAIGLPHVDYVISGLPFMNFPQNVRDQIIDGVVKSLKPGGMFIAFQYSLQMKKQLENRFSYVTIKMVPINIPPAFVYYCTK